LGALSWKKRPREPQQLQHQLQHQLQQAPTPTSETLNTGIYYNPQPSSMPLTEYVSSLVAPTNSSQVVIDHVHDRAEDNGFIDIDVDYDA